MYDEIFATYYTLYRTEAEVPNAEDDEFKIGIPLANVAIRRWSNYDGTYWKELYTTLQTDGGGDLLVTDAVEYATPENMREAGGYVTLRNPVDNSVQSRIPIIEPQEAQFRGDNSNYCYFSGDPNNGFVLHLNPAPNLPLIGSLIDYVYYKKPTLIDSEGNGTPETPDLDYIVHSMLANRFRGSRNPYYNSAKADAEDALKTMQADNNSGSWANPWKLADNSGTSWGQ